MQRVYSVPLLISVIAAFGLAGCGGAPRPVAFGTSDSLNLLGPAVESEVTDALYRVVPGCITVRAVGFDGVDRKNAAIVENSVVRHARDRFDRVIGGAARRDLERKLAVDLSHRRDRQAFADHTGCRHFLYISPWKSEDGYFLVWSRRSIGVAVRLTDIDGRKTLWRARHVAHRQEGGLPLSPISFLIDVARAGAFQADSDIPYSLADDLARRLFLFLPNMRMPSGVDRRQSSGDLVRKQKRRGT